jgi:hypothetical protein
LNKLQFIIHYPRKNEKSNSYDRKDIIIKSCQRHLRGLFQDTEALTHFIPIVPGGGSIPTDVMVQAQRPDLVIIDRSVYGRFRIALVELTCPWDTDAKMTEECKTS